MTADLPDEAQEWHRIAEERRRQLERLQQQRLYQTAASALGRSRRIVARVQHTVDPLRDVGIRLGRSAIALPQRLRHAGHTDALRNRIASLPLPTIEPERRSTVTAVIATASQPARLDALLRALGRIGVSTVVVDNAGVQANAAVIARHPHAQHVRLEKPQNFAAANEQGIAAVTTEWVLLLNDDVAPLDDHWLDRMLAAADDRTVAVGAQLVHGARGILGGSFVDGSVQHAGIGFVLDGPLARPVHLGRGTAPRIEDTVVDVPAATAACLLVRVSTYRAIGGFHTGFNYGSEDVDLCLRLGHHGAVRVAHGAVVEHEEGATRLASGSDRRERAARQTANHRLLDARHAPVLRRNVASAAIRGGGLPGAARVVVAVAGRTPSLLRRVSGLGVTCVDARRRQTNAGMTIVTDPSALSRLTAALTDVPVVGWMEEGSGGDPQWTDRDLAGLDALFVVGRAERPESVPPALVHHVDDEDGLRTALRAVLCAPRWSLRIGSPAGRRAERWGDTAVARALAREFRQDGSIVRLAGRDAWGGSVDRSADVTLHLKGRGVAPVADAQCNVIWVMSHPSEVAPGELDAADLVLAGSPLLAERYRASTATPVEMLPQATDANRFGPGARDAEVASRVLFIGNTRSVPRPVVLGAVDAGLPLTLIGAGWERYLAPQHILGEHLPADELPRWYRSAEIVLNDHWEDMARWGLVSNRVFDALACGACVVSDEVAGIEELFDGAVVTFQHREQVGMLVRALLDDEDERARRSARGQRAVLSAHTWQHRARVISGFVRRVHGHGDERGELRASP